jgi:hypothetical protein
MHHLAAEIVSGLSMLKTVRFHDFHAKIDRRQFWPLGVPQTRGGTTLKNLAIGTRHGEREREPNRESRALCPQHGPGQRPGPGSLLGFTPEAYHNLTAIT